MSQSPIDPKEVQSGLNIVEETFDWISSENDYYNAMLMNQIMMIDQLKRIDSDARSIQTETVVKPQEEEETINKKKLPIGVVGIARENMGSNGRGEAIFQIRGTRIRGVVTAREEIESGDKIYVSNKSNGVNKLRYSDQEVSSEPDDENTASYYSSGKGGITVDNEDWRRIDLGSMYDTVAIWGNGGLDIAFTHPEEADNSIISLSSDQLPYSHQSQTAGHTNISTAFMWYKMNESEGETEIHVFAF